MVSNIKDRVKEIRTDLGFTQQTFADQIGISRAHCANIENGRVTITDAILKLISFKFAINYNWLVTGEGSKHDSFSEETTEGLMTKYNEMRVIFEKKLSSCKYEELKNTVCSFSYFTSIITAPDRLSDENKAICNQRLFEIFDEFEKLIFKYCLSRGKKTDYQIIYENFKALDYFMLQEKKLLSEISDAYLNNE